MANKAHLYSENNAFNGSCSMYNEFAFNQQQQQPLQFVTQQQLQLPLQDVTQQQQQQLSVQNVMQQQQLNQSNGNQNLFTDIGDLFSVSTENNIYFQTALQQQLQLPLQDVTQQQLQQLSVQNVTQQQQTQNVMQQQQQLNQSNGNQNLFTDIGDMFSVSTENNIYFQTALARNLVSQVEKQRQDMQQYINLQSEGFKLVLQQLPIFFKDIQSTMGMLLKQKDEELAESKNKRKEVETFVIELENEKLAWKKMAFEQVGMILQLNNTVQQLREKCLRFNGMDNEADDVVSYCDENMEGTTPKLQLCQCCKSENANVVFLPCRHLCTCIVCQVFYEFCPVCSLKKDYVMGVVLA